MKFMALVPTEVELVPGDTAVLIDNGLRLEKVTVIRIVEQDKPYAVFDNGTWRPLSSYHKTWLKVESKG